MNEGLVRHLGASHRNIHALDNLGLTKSTWDIGEDIMKQGGALRSMSNPEPLRPAGPLQGQVLVASVATPTRENDDGGVHTNSGVLNYWYYLISVGKSGTNEVGNSYSVAGLGLLAASKITFRMESVYMTASSTYAQARTYSVQAATDLYGAALPAGAGRHQCLVRCGGRRGLRRRWHHPNAAARYRHVLRQQRQQPGV
ncbi:MAG: M4 family metallopeptidase [Hymenobacter sp.]